MSKGNGGEKEEGEGKKGQKFNGCAEWEGERSSVVGMEGREMVTGGDEGGRQLGKRGEEERRNGGVRRVNAVAR